jgi:hypothetical protein
VGLGWLRQPKPTVQLPFSLMVIFAMNPLAYNKPDGLYHADRIEKQRLEVYFSLPLFLGCSFTGA